MIEKKLDNGTIIVGREIKISDLETRVTALQAQQVATQADRDYYNSLSKENQEKTILPIDFTEEIETTQERIDRYKDMKIVSKAVNGAPQAAWLEFSP